VVAVRDNAAVGRSYSKVSIGHLFDIDQGSLRDDATSKLQTFAPHSSFG
jgi:hypothetical protein